MSLGRRLYHVMRSRLGDMLEDGGLLDGEKLRHGARTGWRAAERTWTEARDAYRRGRWGEAGASSGAGTSSDARDSSRRGSARDSARDPKMATWYANLELPYGADLDEVTRAWKRLVRSYHPDLHARDPERHANATELVKGLNHAYEQLRQRLEKKR